MISICVGFNLDMARFKDFFELVGLLKIPSTVW